MRRSLFPHNVLRIALMGLVAAAVVSGAVLRERAVFMSRCVTNGNAFTSCWCTFEALPDLPEDYRAVAVSWAHDSHMVYAGNVTMLAAREFMSVWRAQLRSLSNYRSKREAARSYVRSGAVAMGWAAATTAAPAVAAKLTPWLVIAPATYKFGSNVTRARAAMGRHCGGVDTFFVRLDDARSKFERASRELAAASGTVVLNTIEATAETAATASISMWRKLLARLGF